MDIANVDYRTIQLHHHSQRLCNEINAKPDWALQFVLLKQAEADEHVAPECGITQPCEVEDYIEYYISGAVDEQILHVYADIFEDELSPLPF